MKGRKLISRSVIDTLNRGYLVFNVTVFLFYSFKRAEKLIVRVTLRFNLLQLLNSLTIFNMIFIISKLNVINIIKLFHLPLPEMFCVNISLLSNHIITTFIVSGTAG